jgi:hypothetical protein
MAITIIKKPATFFNCTNPAIIEFTTDAVIGNFDDYVCDVFISSQYEDKSAVIRNIFPNTETKIFSVDVSDFLKSLQLHDFEFDFDRNKNQSIEKFIIDIKIRDGSIPPDADFSFDSYYFDNLVFTDGLSAVDETEEIGYSILGERLLFDKFFNPLVTDKLTFLAPEVIEISKNFDNYISIFNNEISGQTVTVNGQVSPIEYEKGVSTFFMDSEQYNSIHSLTAVTCTNQNPSKKLFAFPFYETCDETVQFRFFNNKGGFSFFYANIDSKKADRSKVSFYNNSYFNENENKSGAVQSDSDYKNTIEFKGTKIGKLKELFDMLLRSPKVEMNLKQINGNDLFIECNVTGSIADQFTVFDFKLKAEISNSGNFKL